MIRRILSGRRAVWLVFVFVLLAVGEGVARVLLPAPLPWRQPQVRFRSDPQLVFSLVPGQTAFTANQPVHINVLGLRGPLLPAERRADTMRFLVLGDSVAFGFGVADANVLGTRAAGLLADAGVEAEPINAAVPCYNFAQGVAFLERDCEHYAPDWVAAVLSWNDFGDKSGVRVSDDGLLISAGAATPPGARWANSERAYVVRNTLKRSRLLYGVRRLLWVAPEREAKHRAAVLGGKTTPEIERGWRDFEKAAAALVRLSARCGFRPVILALPFRSLIEGAHPRSSYPSRAIAVASAHGIPILDLESAFRHANAHGGPLFLPYDEDHPNAAGHLIAAEALARFLNGHANDDAPPGLTARLEKNGRDVHR